MIAVLVFLAIIVAIAGWWLAGQRLMSKPWLETGAAGVPPGTEAIDRPAIKVGLGIFLAVIGGLFALFISAYFMRMELPDWRALAMPRILWLNTGILVLSSVALHCAVIAARAGKLKALRQDLMAGGVAAVLFLVGQGLAWQEIAAQGYFATSTPASSFFYLLTGVHGLHIAGGLLVLARTTIRAWTPEKPDQLRISTELCATYWHFMLLIWFVIIVLLAGWLSDFVDICRQLIV
jgi:cytochrome c oxidase subunit 3